MAEEFKITEDEASKIKEALKKPEFRKLLAEYAEEISDPENKKRNEEELIALEKQRGVDMKYIHPKPGFVLKSFLLPESTRKIFINVCHNEIITAASSTPSKSKKKKGERWSIPYSLTPPREDVDKTNNKCTVVDAVFNTETLHKGTDDSRFKQMLVDTVLDGLETRLHLKVDRSKVIHLRMPYKGVPVPAVIRKKVDSETDEGSKTVGGLKIPFPPLKEEQEAKSHRNQQRVKQAARPPTEPKYTLVHRGEFSLQDFTNQRESTRVGRPKELVVGVELPGVESASSVKLDIFERRLALESKKPPYSLDLALPFPIDEEKGSAKFDKTKKILTVTLPVLPPPATHTHLPPAGLIQEDADVSDSDKTQPLENGSSETARADEEEGGLTPEGVSVGDPLLSESPPNISPTPAVDQEQQQPEVDTPVQAPQDDWTSTGEWVCPPFSYRQEDSVVVFCLHTASAKEKTLVKYFDEYFVQLTYGTDKGENYSFYVSFPEGCGLDVDDCSVDVSEDNIVLLLKKDTPESDETSAPHQWDKFSVGLNASQTSEKLFLTASNVESVLQRVDDLPDPWKMGRVWSDSATASATTAAGEERIDIEIVDPELEAKMDNSTSTSPGHNNSVSKIPNDDKEVSQDKTDAGKRTLMLSGSSQGEGVENVDSSKDPPVTENSSLEETGSKPSVRVEADGSVFIRGDSDYLKNREEVKVALKGEGETVHPEPSAASGKVKLSNKLLYSLD